MEVWRRACPAGGQPDPARGLQAGRVRQQVLRRRHRNRCLLLPPGGAAFRTPAVLLRGDGVRAVHDDSVGVLDVLLAGPQGGARPGGPGGDHPPGHVHHAGQHPEQPPARRLHQGHRRLVRRLRILRLQRSARVRPRQLRFQVKEFRGLRHLLNVTS